jgi:hypothetical protein
MESLHVSRLSARYRLPAGEPDARARLDRVLRGVLDEALDQALSRAGVPAHEEVCIRSVHAPARLRLAVADADLAAAWSVALADAIRATLDAGGPGVVRYGSRSQAVIDLLLGVAAGDLRRAWAWRQMGLWSAGDSPSAALAAEEAARTLVSRPESIVAAVAAAARAGVLPVLAARIAPPAWVVLARTALAAASLADSVAAALLASPAPPRLPAPSTASSADGPRAGAPPAAPVASDTSVTSADALGAQADAAASAAVRRVLRASRIAAALSADAAAVASLAEHPEVRRALAILAVLEAEPSALLRPSAVALVASVERETSTANLDTTPEMTGHFRQEDRDDALFERAVRTRAQVDRAAPLSSADAIDRAVAPPSSGDALDRSAVADSATPDRAFARTDESQSTRLHSTDRPESPDDRGWEAEAGEAVISRTAASDTSSSANRLEDKKDSKEERSLPAVRVEAETRWGGLLFLVNLLTQLELPSELLDAFPARPLHWTLHRLALELLPLDPRDPAALAFAGLPPDRDPPSQDEPPAADEETAAIAAVATRVTRALHERVAQEPVASTSPGTGEVASLSEPERASEPERLLSRPAEDGRQATATLREVCRRDATVSADPGWIELRLRLDQVSVDVRRAGLDLDPDWVPWLGAVVRFVYE